MNDALRARWATAHYEWPDQAPANVMLSAALLAYIGHYSRCLLVSPDLKFSESFRFLSSLFLSITGTFAELDDIPL